MVKSGGGGKAGDKKQGVKRRTPIMCNVLM